MTEDSNKELWRAVPDDALPGNAPPAPETAAPPETGEPEEVVSCYTMPEDPEEIVSWYTAPEEEPREVVDYYVHSRPLPGAERRAEEPEKRPAADVWSAAAARERKRRRRGLWIFLACLLVVLGAVAAAVWPTLSDNRRSGEEELEPQDGDSASSIVDIFGYRKTTIPRFTGDPSVRLTVSTERGEELTAAEVYVKVNPSVVTVVSEAGSNGASIGTGIIMTADGYVITNAHVISGGASCWIALDNGATYDARLVGYDEDEDLAVLKAMDASGLPAAEFGDSEQLVVGDKAYAIGNPLGVELRGTLTDGIISAVNRQVEVEGGYMTMLQTTAALNNGNSGGPLINSAGQIVGINTLKMSGTGWEGEATVEGLGFALPISSVCFVVNDLIATGEFRGVPTIGVTVVTTQDDHGGMQVVVYSVEPGLGAEEAGVLAGDVILAADGVPVSRTEDLLAVRRTHSIGDTLRLTLQRGEETVEADVTLYSSKGR
ncbi:MAG: serine protease [Ruminococcaceae bacterium]|jgi:serine protease Do|nr:serine protease [Oscillospiraceae bacterium]